MKKYLPMHLFNMLKEILLYNNRYVHIQYEDGYTSYDILFEGSKSCPRKLKKRIRAIIN